MKILSVKIHGIDCILKQPILIEEEIIIVRGKQMYKFFNDDFKLLAYHKDVDCCEKSIIDSLNLIIDSYLFEPDYVVSQNSMELRNKIARCVYG